jgi:hypothetical protein
LKFSAQRTPLPDLVSAKEQNSLLFVLLGMKANWMESLAMHHLVIFWKAERNDLNKYEGVVV